MQHAEQKNEILQSPELLHKENTRSSEENEGLSSQKVAVIIQERLKMLSEIKVVLSPTFVEALAIKIEHERESLQHMIATDAKMQEMHRSRNAVLPHTFFKKKVLNPNSL